MRRCLRPFVYRRAPGLRRVRKPPRDRRPWIDRRGYGSPGALADNIKLGRGGIREIEFIAQAFQLIRGGQEPELQCRRLLPTLERLVARLAQLQPSGQFGARAGRGVPFPAPAPKTASQAHRGMTHPHALADGRGGTAPLSPRSVGYRGLADAFEPPSSSRGGGIRSRASSTQVFAAPDGGRGRGRTGMDFSRRSGTPP
ncbi:MAG: hypothetical protein U5L11_02295 [Arhodomonas sp.]|nr:hypothetical protein [Arhodomonas sp.]